MGSLFVFPKTEIYILKFCIKCEILKYIKVYN